jgi:hypothetical protein
VYVWHHATRVAQLAAVADPLQHQLLVDSVVLGCLDVGWRNVLAVAELAEHLYKKTQQTANGTDSSDK